MGQMMAKKPLKEILRENKRMINRAVRELEREKVTLERNEKKLEADIKKYAKEGQMVSALKLLHMGILMILSLSIVY